jgi:hypothetical protein
MRCVHCLARRLRRSRARAGYRHLTHEATDADYLRLEFAEWYLDWLYDRAGVR